MTSVSEERVDELESGVGPTDDARGERRKVTFDITPSAVAKIVVGLLLLAFIGDLAAQMREVFVWTLAAAFLAIALNPLVERLEPRLGRRVAATVVVLVSVIGLLAIVAALVMPFVTQVDRLSTAVPQAISEARQDSTIKRLDDRYHIARHAREHLDSLPGVVFGAAGTVLGGAVAVSTIFFLTLFLLYELPGIARVALAQIPPARRPRFLAAVRHMNRNVGGYVAGNLVISVICGATTTIGLYLLDVPFSLALGVFMAVFDLIPLVGATIGGVVIGVVTAFNDFPTATIVWVIVFLVYQQVENNVLQPLVYRKTVDVSPLLVIVAILIGSTLLGVLGALVAIPVAAAVQIVARDAWARREPPLPIVETPGGT
jgi:predicted PurR-regulated permease PerM